MENTLDRNILTKEYLLNCIAKHEKRINALAYKEKQYRSHSNHTAELDQLIEYRKPFIDVLMRAYGMSIKEIRSAVSDVRDKNIPTNVMCDRIRDIILKGCYSLG